ncbi:MAG: DedA family protein [Candidatus Curtissbacteria bacterium]|nr:DedA family protein [Candidatus Curtissbacteria bacterium]
MPSFSDLIALVEYSIIRWGLLIIPIGAFLENSVILGFVFPGVTLIFLSGFAARSTDANIGVIIALATLGALIGDNFDYFIGKHTGRLLDKKPLFARPVATVEPLLKKHGIWAIFAGRFSGVSRAWVALVCGVTRYPYWKFLIVSAFSALIWTSIWVFGGYVVGGDREFIERWLNRFSIVAWIVFAGILVYYFRTRIRLIIDLIGYTSKKYGTNIKNRVKNNHELQSEGLGDNEENSQR